MTLSSSRNLILSIIIVNYNGKAYLMDCLRSISDKLTIVHEIIIVDNASPDGSAQYIKNNYPLVRLIENNYNAGFSAGNNLGVLAAKGKYLLLLNNDTVMLEDVQPAIDAFEGMDDIGVIGCNLLYGDMRLQFSYGYDHTPLRIALSWFGLKKFAFLPNIFRREEIQIDCYKKLQANVGWVSGAFLMTRKYLWEKLDGMDAQYFMYVEDVDYCKRVRSSGYRVVYMPEVKVIHYEGGGKAWIGGNALKNTFRSYVIYLKKYHSRTSGVLVRFVLFMVMMMRAVAYLLMFQITKKPVCKDKFMSFYQVGAMLLREKVL